MTHSGVLATILSGLEPAVAIALACIPLMRPLLGRKSTNVNDSRYKYDSSKMSKIYSKKAGRDTSNTFSELVDDNDASSEVQLQPMNAPPAARESILQHGQLPPQKNQDIVVKTSWEVVRH
jgi:hypothetical protein